MNSATADTRLQMLTNWIHRDLRMPDAAIAPASADASFRRYFRITSGAHSLIVMDAPPDKEDLGPFLRVGRLLDSVGVHVPKILQENISQGFLLLSDLGSRQYLDALKSHEDPDRLYGDALSALVKIQLRGRESGRILPPYDKDILTREMNLMPEWFLGRHLQVQLSPEGHATVEQLFARLSACALEQPSSLVHRDYHSRNLMLLPKENPGILDFQDALYGPITYDLVSLLKDCYIAWPAERVRDWMCLFRARLAAAGAPAGRDDAQFERWFDFAGMQRHIKVLGIFARLWYRDGKSGYLSDLPLVFRYVRETAARYSEFDDFSALLSEVLEPAFLAAQRRTNPAGSAGE